MTDPRFEGGWAPGDPQRPPLPTDPLAPSAYGSDPLAPPAYADDVHTASTGAGRDYPQAPARGADTGSSAFAGSGSPGGAPSRRADDGRSIGEIISDLSSKFSTLVQQEIALAKAEATQQAQRLGKGAGMFGGAGAAGMLALTFLSLGLWWWIAVSIGDHDHPALGWAGLIVGVLYAIVAAILAAAGRSQMRKAGAGLPQTQETVSKIPNALKGDEEENR